MSIPPLPKGVDESDLMRAANALHSLSIHLLRRARVADRACGLTRERLSILSVLAYAGPRTIGTLAAIEDVTAPAISRSVAALEEGGLVRRRRLEADGREVMVFSTDKGKKIVEAGRKGRLAIIAGELSSLSRADLEAIEAIAGRIEARGVKEKT